MLNYQRVSSSLLADFWYPLISFEELETPKSLAATLALKKPDCKGWEARFPAKI